MNMQNRRPDGIERPDPLRRRLAKGGLAVPVVLSTLGSKPVLGAVPYRCSISGQISGNTSSAGGVDLCASLGDTPADWAARKNEEPTKSELKKDFNGYSAAGATLAAAFWSHGNQVFLTKPANGGGPATLLQVLEDPATVGAAEEVAFGRATVASLLNAIRYAPDYPLRPEDVIGMFNAVHAGGTFSGTYRINDGTSWPLGHVQDYFESLYS